MKKIWAWPAQAATWLVGLIVIFVVSPPRLAVGEPPPTIGRFVEFALAIIIGVVFALSSGRPSRENRRFYAIASGSFLLLAIVLFGAYSYLGDHWTCRYDSDDPMVIGFTLLPDAARYVAQNPGMDCSTLIQDFAGQTSLIWPRSELINRRLILSGLFSLVVIAFALAALFVMRALGATGKEPEEPPARP
ncbi:hypothetical protein PIB19_12515 [Sphingomonas sp. 7/4-4]|uniref:hypothetical protein n=1 Tax=Sphingomonas sp. 7/4-4 TaxID=3018446 RepID=UPI0022F3B492|nr:hypothetical protein [Sphingomonas sp. 7/4-4]WBY06421.1 hypothetical protein PIB19_12515 [Sphingomonas sp. 7/4-4]